MNKIVILACGLFFICHNWILTVEPAYTPIEDQAHLPILTPDLADRTTAKIRLANGLEAYLVSDPKADKSGIAMTVKTGSWEDPREYPGIAHFLEHMLFLGTKKYPHESEYSRYVSEHGGMANAFTTDDFTSYLLAINHSAFPEALDRFASFFKEPLFNPSGVDRELQAIDQEYSKNLENDDFRQLYVIKELGNPDHPFHAFSMGNKNSLSHVSQSTLKKWYSEHYSANQMRLVVVSAKPLSQLKELVVDAFKDVPNLDTPPFNLTLNTTSPTLNQQMVYISPIKNLRKLTIYWELPQKFGAMNDTKPAGIICHVLGHEGEKSLLAQLKTEKLANNVRCASHKFGNALYLFLEIDLTNEGLQNVDTVIERAFQAIKAFKERGIPPYIFEELQRMSIIDYQYQVREDAFSSMMRQAEWIANEDLSTYPEQTFIIQKFDPESTQELLDYLTPQNSFFNLMAPPNLTGMGPDRQERWLGVPYTVKAISQEKIARWTLIPPHPQIDLPAPNPLIPQKLELIESSSPQESKGLPQPKVIFDNEFGKIYFAPDTRYQLPKIYWSFELKSPLISLENASSIALGDLFVRAVTEALNEEAYNAEMAGLHVSVNRSDNGIDFLITGFNENAHQLFEQVLTELKTIKPTESQFKIYRDSLLRQYENAAASGPLDQAAEFLKTLLYKYHVMNKQKAAAIKKISFVKFQHFIDQFLKKIYIEGMLYGNMSESQARHLSQTLFDTIKDHAEPYPKVEHLQQKAVVLPQQGPFYFEAKTKSQGSAAILAIHDIPYSFKARAAQQILMQAMQEPFFSALRTQQQTCYLVHTSAEDIKQQLFDCFMVQSSTHDVRDLLARFELVIEGFLQELTKTELPSERFESIKNSLLTTLEQPPKNLEEMGDLLNVLAFEYNGDFDRIAKRIQGFRELSYPEFVTLSSHWLSKANKCRLAVLLKGVCPEERILEYKKISKPQLRKLTFPERN